MKQFLCVLLVVSLCPLLADAAMVISIDRTSDSLATLTFSGNYSGAASARGGRMFLPLVVDNNGGAGTIGANTVISGIGATINAATAEIATVYPAGYPYTGTPIELYLNWTMNPAGTESVSGSIEITLPAGTNWAPAGTTGDVWYGRNNSAVALVNGGTYEIVPEPATMGLLLLGGLGLLARRRR